VITILFQWIYLHSGCIIGVKEVKQLDEINAKELRAGLEYSRNLAGIPKTELAARLDMHPNTYRRKEHNPATFTLEDLLKLKKALNKKTIEDIFVPEKEGKQNAAECDDKA
jgi:DNA-binding XRE family transcriptional regulator